MPEYTKEKLWKIYQGLPEELKEAIFSVKTADSIYNACAKNGIEDNRVSEVARYTGRVLLGLISKDDFQKALEKKVKLKKDIAKAIVKNIDHYVFFPVKASLDLAIKPFPESKPAPVAKIPVSEMPKKESPLKKRKLKQDQYLEPIK